MAPVSGITSGSSASEDKKCFHICPIGKADSVARKRSDQIFKHVVKATVEPLGYSATRADQVEESGTITSQIIDGLLSSEIVTADLTDHNPNVFYELALRHAFAKPFVQLVADEQILPFDIQGLRTIRFDYRDLDAVHDAKATLLGMVESIEAGKPVETPLNYALNLQNLKQSGDSEARGIADILVELQSLKQTLRPLPKYNVALGKESHLRSDISTICRFVEELVAEGRLTVDDIRRLMYMSGLSEARSAWSSQIIEKYFSSEAPF